MSVTTQADQLLQDAVNAGRVPGVVAMATDREGTIYEDAFGERVLGSGQAMTADTVGWIASTTPSSSPACPRTGVWPSSSTTSARPPAAPPAA